MTLEMLEAQPVIETERFDLRPLRASDAGLLALHAGDERVARNTSSIPHPLPPGATEAFVARAQDPGRDERIWTMDAAKSGGAEVMGVISLKQVEQGQCEVSFWVAPAFWNSGVASTAVEALIAGNPQSCRMLFATVFQDNPASARVLTNCGFSYIGDAEAFSVARGAKVATWTYSLKLH